MKFNYLQDITIIRDNLITAFMQDKELINALLNRDLTVDIFDKGEVIDRNIFPYKKAFLDTMQTKYTMITMDYEIDRLINNNFNHVYMNIYILVHEDNMRLLRFGKNMLRTDLIAHRIDILTNDKNGVWVGKMRLVKVAPLDYVPQHYNGLMMTFEITSLK